MWFQLIFTSPCRQNTNTYDSVYFEWFAVFMHQTGACVFRTDAVLIIIEMRTAEIMSRYTFHMVAIDIMQITHVGSIAQIQCYLHLTQKRFSRSLVASNHATLHPFKQMHPSSCTLIACHNSASKCV